MSNPNTHYHQVIPETVCDAVRGFFGRILGLNIDWSPPLDGRPESVVDWPTVMADAPNQMVSEDGTL